MYLWDEKPIESQPDAVVIRNNAAQDKHGVEVHGLQKIRFIEKWDWPIPGKMTTGTKKKQLTELEGMKMTFKFGFKDSGVLISQPAARRVYFKSGYRQEPCILTVEG